MTGLFLSRSLVGLAMVLPVFLLSGVLALKRRPGLGSIAVASAVAVGLAVLAYIMLVSTLPAVLEATDLSGNSLERREVHEATVAIARDHWPVGTGLGAFEFVYPAYENPAAVTSSRIVHAHNDYLEVAAELGAAGCVVLAGILIWWVVMTVLAWRASREQGGPLKRAASLAVGVLLVQSLIDNPARTEAIACLAAVCLAIMSSGAAARREEGGQVGAQRAFAHRHLEL
jgi:O-antigen ligase